jgi:outer membrane protein OmpA-like peptidoglycan-associated protein
MNARRRERGEHHRLRGRHLAVLPLALAVLLGAGLTPLTSAWAYQRVVTSARSAATTATTTSAANSLKDVDCTGLGSCIAVGEFGVAAGTQALLEVSSSGTWTQVAVPLPADASTSAPDNELVAVTCFSATSCVAVGSYATSTGEAALLIAGSGDDWTDVVVPLPGDASTVAPSNELDAVACTSSTSCVAVGDYANGASDEQALLVNDVGGTWSDSTVPLPVDASTDSPNNVLIAVTCAAPDTCEAVGSYETTSNTEQALLVNGVGLSWSNAVVPLPPDANAAPNNYLDAVACASSASCEAAGSYVDAQGNTQALLVDSSSGTWTPTIVPLPADASTTPSFNTLTALTCTSEGNCIAVGVYENVHSYQEAIMDEETAGTWAATTVPLPADANAVIPFDALSAVSCPAAGNCVAVGFYSGTLGFLYPHALLDVEVNGTWFAGSVALPTNANTVFPYSSLASESCVSILGCVAVGLYADIDGGTQTLITNLGLSLASVPVVPSPPTAVSASPGHGQVRVSWRASTTDGTSALTGYTATAIPGGASCTTTGTSCVVRPLVESPSYTISVTANSDLGSSLPSTVTAPVEVKPVIDKALTLSPFAEGSSTLTPSMKSSIATFAEDIAVLGDTVVSLTGYDDNTRSLSKSRALSLARADAVRSYLAVQLDDLSLNYIRIPTSGRGDAAPVASNTTPAGRAKNCRVVANAT